MSSAAATSTGGVVKEEEDSTTTFDSASADVERLGEWLALAGVDHASFSVKNGGTKTLVDLFNECVLGESTLTMHVNGKTGERMATRTTRVLTTRVRRRADVERGDDSKCLIELEQRFDNGKTRSRMRPLSEKMLPGEDWRACATRAVTEELGSALADGFSIHPLDDTYTFCISDRDSASYPGLPTRFALHRVDVIVDGLPDDDEFESVEALPNGRGFLRARWGFRDFAWTDDDLGPA
jgi:8-oxo-dGTP pyrophosphatase MutT (NUDIX family)